MKKHFISGVISGALVFGTIGVFAGQYIATDNPYPVQLNGQNINLEGYQINDYTYFKLRDIADATGGFDVSFQNDTIQLSKDGYVYNTDKLEFTDTIKEYFLSYGIRIPEFDQTTLNSDEFVRDFVFYYYTGIGNVDSPLYHNGYFDWSVDTVKNQYKLLFGTEMPDYYPLDTDPSPYYPPVIYNNGYYEIMASDYGDEAYFFDSYTETSTGLELHYLNTDYSGTDIFGQVIFVLTKADNANGYIIESKTYIDY